MELKPEKHVQKRDIRIFKFNADWCISRPLSFGDSPMWFGEFGVLQFLSWKGYQKP